MALASTVILTESHRARLLRTDVDAWAALPDDDVVEVVRGTRRRSGRVHLHIRRVTAFDDDVLGGGSLSLYLGLSTLLYGPGDDNERDALIWPSTTRLRRRLV